MDANNRIAGQTYDANGNMTSGASSTLTYDVDNRAGLSSESYAYDANNKRIWKKRALGGGAYAEDVYFYGIDGSRLATFTWNSGGYWTVKSADVRFAGKLLYTNNAWVATDRLGSIRYRQPTGTAERLDFFPYGEERPSATAQDRDKFATYMRDDTGLDYADQRYFTNTSGRFVTPDPAGDGTNWYAYAGGDPVNSGDPSGLGPITGSALGYSPNDITFTADAVCGAGCGPVVTAPVPFGAPFGPALLTDDALRAQLEVVNQAYRAQVAINMAANCAAQLEASRKGGPLPDWWCPQPNPLDIPVVPVHRAVQSTAVTAKCSGGGGLGVVISSTAEGGSGAVGAAATVGNGIGIFYDGSGGLSVNSFVDYGIAGGIPGQGQFGTPQQSNPTIVGGAFAGVGFSVFGTNASSINGLAGSFSTSNVNIGIGAVAGSASVQLSGNTILIQGSGPGMGFGSGLDFSHYATNTLVEPNGACIP